MYPLDMHPGYRSTFSAALLWLALATLPGCGAAFLPDECFPGASQCAAAGVQTCVLGPSGNHVWGSAVPCPTGQACSAGVCSLTCADECTLGQRECVGSTPRQCEVSATGCARWTTQSACGAGFICSGGNCAGCSQHGECDAVSVCTHLGDPARGRCVPESGRQWDVYIWKVEFTAYDASGAVWDPGGTPDPKVSVKVNDVVQGSISADDTYKIDRTGKTFSPIRITLKTGDTFTLTAWDVDVSSDDYADGGLWTNALSLARSGAYSGPLGKQVVSVNLSIRPVP